MNVPNGMKGAWLGLMTKIGPLIALAFVWGVFAIGAGAEFVSWANTQLMLQQTVVVGAAALGATVIIVSGAIDLSVGSAIALVTVVVAIILQKGATSSVAGLGGVAAGLGCGLLIGLLVTRLRLSPFIVTLGMWGAFRGLAKGVAGNTMVYPPSETWLNRLIYGDQLILAPAIFLTLGLAMIVAGILRYTRFGRHVFAIGSNEATARLCGVAVGRTKLLVYGLAGCLTGVAGVLQFSFLTMGDPTTALGYELKVIAAVVIGGASLAGGTGSIVGTLMGAMIMTVVDNGCTKLQMPNWVQEIVTGAIIIAAVTLDRLRHSRSV